MIVETGIHVMQECLAHLHRIPSQGDLEEMVRGERWWLLHELTFQCTQVLASVLKKYATSQGITSSLQEAETPSSLPKFLPTTLQTLTDRQSPKGYDDIAKGYDDRRETPCHVVMTMDPEAAHRRRLMQRERMVAEFNHLGERIELFRLLQVHLKGSQQRRAADLFDHLSTLLLQVRQRIERLVNDHAHLNEDRQQRAVALLQRMTASGITRYRFHQWLRAHERVKQARLNRNAAASMLVTTERGLQRLYFQKLLRHAQVHLKGARQRRAAALLLGQTENGARRQAYRKLSLFAQAQQAQRARQLSITALLQRMTASGITRYRFHQWLRAHERVKQARLKCNAAASMLVTTERGLQRLCFQKLLRHSQVHLKVARQRRAAALFLGQTENGARRNAYRKLSLFVTVQHAQRARQLSITAEDNFFNRKTTFEMKSAEKEAELRDAEENLANRTAAFEMESALKQAELRDAQKVLYNQMTEFELKSAQRDAELKAYEDSLLNRSSEFEGLRNEFSNLEEEVSRKRSELSATDDLLNERAVSMKIAEEVSCKRIQELKAMELSLTQREDALGAAQGALKEQTASILSREKVLLLKDSEIRKYLAAKEQQVSQNLKALQVNTAQLQRHTVTMVYNTSQYLLRRRVFQLWRDHTTSSIISRYLLENEEVKKANDALTADYDEWLEWRKRRVNYNQELKDVRAALAKAPQDALKECERLRLAHAPWLGFDVNASVVVRSVFPGSPAHKAGLRIGDRCFGIDDMSCSNVTEFREAGKVAFIPGRTVVLHIEHDAAIMTLLLRVRCISEKTDESDEGNKKQPWPKGFTLEDKLLLVSGSKANTTAIPVKPTYAEPFRSKSSSHNSDPKSPRYPSKSPRPMPPKSPRSIPSKSPTRTKESKGPIDPPPSSLGGFRGRAMPLKIQSRSVDFSGSGVYHSF